MVFFVFVLFLLLFLFSFICLIAVLSPRTKAKVMSGRTQLTLPHCSLAKPTKQLTDTK